MEKIKTFYMIPGGGLLRFQKFNEREKIGCPTLMYDGKPCWIATDFLKKIGYEGDNSENLINKCIKSQDFEEGIEYLKVTGDRLILLKNIITGYEESNNIDEPIISKHTRHLVLFFKEGACGFLNSSRLQIGKDYRKYVRREVMPSVLKYGMYIDDTLLGDNNLLLEKLNKLVADKNKELEEKNKEIEEKDKKFEVLSKEHESLNKEAKFAFVLRADAEYELERCRKKNRELRKKLRETKPTTDEYGNVLTDYERDNYN